MNTPELELVAQKVAMTNWRHLIRLGINASGDIDRDAVVDFLQEMFGCQVELRSPRSMDGIDSVTFWVAYMPIGLFMDCFDPAAL